MSRNNNKQMVSRGSALSPKQGTDVLRNDLFSNKVVDDMRNSQIHNQLNMDIANSAYRISVSQGSNDRKQSKRMMSSQQEKRDPVANVPVVKADAVG